jgi:hypothetical protein
MSLLTIVVEVLSINFLSSWDKSVGLFEGLSADMTIKEGILSDGEADQPAPPERIKCICTNLLQHQLLRPQAIAFSP